MNPPPPARRRHRGRDGPARTWRVEGDGATQCFRQSRKSLPSPRPRFQSSASAKTSARMKTGPMRAAPQRRPAGSVPPPKTSGLGLNQRPTAKICTHDFRCRERPAAPPFHSNTSSMPGPHGLVREPNRLSLRIRSDPQRGTENADRHQMEQANRGKSATSVGTAEECAEPISPAPRTATPANLIPKSTSDTRPDRHPYREGDPQTP